METNSKSRSDDCGASVLAAAAQELARGGTTTEVGMECQRRRVDGVLGGGRLKAEESSMGWGQHAAEESK